MKTSTVRQPAPELLADSLCLNSAVALQQGGLLVLAGRLNLWLSFSAEPPTSSELGPCLVLWFTLFLVGFNKAVNKRPLCSYLWLQDTLLLAAAWLAPVCGVSRSWPSTAVTRLAVTGRGWRRALRSGSSGDGCDRERLLASRPPPRAPAVSPAPLTVPRASCQGTFLRARWFGGERPTGFE